MLGTVSSIGEVDFSPTALVVVVVSSVGRVVVGSVATPVGSVT